MLRHYFNPADPSDLYCNPLPDHPSREELEQYQRISLRLLVQTVITLLVLMVAFAVLTLFTSCTSVKESTTDVSRHNVETLIQHLDSAVGHRTVIQQDSAWRQTILRQFQSIREHSDTSRTQVVDTAGRVIRETIIINNTKETDNSTSSSEREVLLHRLDVVDSTLLYMIHQQSHIDSVLHSHQTVAVVEPPVPWWKRALVKLEHLAFLLAVLYVIYQFIRIKILKH